MGLLDLESVKRRQSVHEIAHFAKYTKSYGSMSVRLKYILNYGKPVQYLITKAGKEILNTPDIDEAVNFYNNLYLNL